jgi:Flagellar hook-length control protein FliK
MDIQSSPLLTSLSVKTKPVNLSQLLLGQILNATVTARKSPDTLVLQIQNQQVEAKTDPAKPINVGDQLKLVVEKQDNPIVLRVTQKNSTALVNDSKPQLVQETKQQLLRENIPKQAGMEKLVNVLNHVSKNVGGIIKIFPAPIEKQIKKLIEHLPEKSHLKNEAGLKTVIKNSGLLLESKLLPETNTSEKPIPSKITTNQANTANLANDLKSNLLQLSESLGKYKPVIKNTEHTTEKTISAEQLITIKQKVSKNTNTRAENTARILDISSKVDIEHISKHIESSIARIEVNQSKIVLTHDNQMPVWSVEVPVKDKKDIDLLKLDIQPDSETKSKDEKDQIWTVNLNINFENTGTVSARLSILGNEVNASLWSDNTGLNKLIDNNLSYLNKQIEKCGLSAGKIVCLDASPIIQEETPQGNNLINITI